VICEYAYWDREGKDRTDYEPGEFERLHSEGVRVELLYEGGISTAEISSLPFLLRHLEEAHEGCTLRFKSIEDAPGGARVSFVVDETGGADPDAIKAQLEEEGRRCQAALRTPSLERQSKQRLEEDYAKLKEQVFPLLLQAAERSLLPDSTNTFQAAVLFSDLTGFSQLGDDERADALQLLRGILKPILSRWHGDFPNMWGDALRATFEDVNDALECACRIQAAIASQGLSQRIGMDHGGITAKYNLTIEGMDIEGDAVNMAARLEPLANPGEVLVTEHLRYHPDADEQRFTFTERTVQLRKCVGDLEAGTELTCFVVSLNSFDRPLM
jgi:class 3 adenylate cyclase